MVTRFVLASLILAYFMAGFISPEASASSRSSGDPCIDALLASLSELQNARMPKQPGPEMNAAADYFIVGVYVNAMLIAAAGEKVEQDILKRAEQELPQEEFLSIRENLDRLIDSQAPAAKSFKVYRGQNLQVPKPADGYLYKKGEILKFPHFLSTASTEELAFSFQKGVMLEITIPKGFKSFDIHKFLQSGQPGTEFVLPRGARMKVTSVEYTKPPLVRAKLIK